MKPSEVITFLILRTIGNFLVLLSLYGVIATFGPAIYFETNFRINQIRGVHYIVDQSVNAKDSDEQLPSGFGQLLSSSTDQILQPKDPSFSILIPKIGASAKVFPNVDPNNRNEFLPVLMKGVAHAKGTVFPGMSGNTYLFAHSTDNWWNVGRYNAVFYLLKDLTPGDDVTVFYENRRFNYLVQSSVIADPTDVSYLENSHTGEEKLILQTCWPPGTTWKRIIVSAVPKLAK